MRLAAASFTLQLPQHRSAFGQLAVEELARDPEHVCHQRARQRVVGLGALAPDSDDISAAEDGEVLRHDRLFQREQRLQILDGLLALGELFEDPDARRVGERSKEVAFENLKRCRQYIEILL